MLLRHAFPLSGEELLVQWVFLFLHYIYECAAHLYSTISPFFIHHYTILPFYNFTISWYLDIILFIIIQGKFIKWYRITKALMKFCYLSLKRYKCVRVQMWLKLLYGLWEIYHPSRVSKIYQMKLSGEGWRIIRRIKWILSLDNLPRAVGVSQSERTFHCITI